MGEPPELLASLGAETYRGPLVITEMVPLDIRGRGEPQLVIYLPADVVEEFTRRAVSKFPMPSMGGPGGEAAAAPEQEITDPELIDPAHNTPTANLRAWVVPSIPNAGERSIASRIVMTHSFWAYDWNLDQWYQVSDGEVLESKLTARDNAAGHHHGSEEQRTLEQRVGRLDPAAGHFSGTWRNTWRTPEFAQEVRDEYRVRWVDRQGNTEDSWFSSTAPLVARISEFIRVPTHSSYDRVGGTTPHPEDFNDWGEPALVNAISSFAREYHRLTDDRTRVNDISLFYGGKFDLDANYGTGRTSHQEHRLGTEVDLRPYRVDSPTHRADFERLLRRYFASHIYELTDPPHYHARSANSIYNR
jgi:hypothetical protein